MPLFLDACALAKRYLPEYGSKRMKEITGRFERWGGFVVSGFVEPEVISALARYARDHRTHSTDYLRQHPGVVDQFRKELSERAFTVVSVTDEVVEQASDLLRNKPEYTIHAGDAVHLATALALRPQLDAADTLVFVTADRGLELAAQAEGLATYNPIREGIGRCERSRGPPEIERAPWSLTLDTTPVRGERPMSRVNRPPPHVYMIRIARTCRRNACLAHREAGAVRVRGGAPGG